MNEEKKGPRVPTVTRPNSKTDLPYAPFIPNAGRYAKPRRRQHDKSEKKKKEKKKESGQNGKLPLSEKRPTPLRRPRVAHPRRLRLVFISEGTYPRRTYTARQSQRRRAPSARAQRDMP